MLVIIDGITWAVYEIESDKHAAYFVCNRQKAEIETVVSCLKETYISLEMVDITPIIIKQFQLATLPVTNNSTMFKVNLPVACDIIRQYWGTYVN